MAGLIPRDFIEDLVARSDIVEVIGSRVQLKKSGREFAACCPFHGEKTASFFVSPQKQFYHCFGCGVHGNALGFLIEYEHMEFVDPVEELARQLGVDVPREGGSAPQRERTSPDLYEILDDAARFYRQQLKATPDAVEYLKQRGLTGEIAAEFGIGWAPGGWDALLKALGTSDARRELLELAGMLSRREDRTYDRFRERIMFPIRDGRGRTIAFGGRILKGDDQAKYMNSPETPVFHKGRELYGLYEVRQALRDIPRLLVVEGYMDVVALAQHGIRYAVATLGTSTTPEHLHKLFRVTPEVVFCFDGDRAGRAAAWRALEQALPEAKDGRQMRFLFLPDGEDPDSMVRSEGAERFAARIETAQTLSMFLLERLSAEVDLTSLDGRARLAELARPLVAKVPDGAFRHLLAKELSARTGVEPESLTKLMGEAPAAVAPSRRVRARVPIQMTPVRKAIQYLLKWPELAVLVRDPDTLAALEQPGAALLGELAAWLNGHPNATAAVVLEHWRGTEHEPALLRLAEVEPLVSAAEAKTEFVDLLVRVAGQGFRARTERRLEELIQKAPGLSDPEKAELRLLLEAKNPRETGV
ncbi:MAG: DNA primase [Gammaproteobacteria bacterium]